MIDVCTLTLLLSVNASGHLTEFSNPRIFGDCLAREFNVTLYISPYTREFVIAREKDIFYVDLPKKRGYYDLQIQLPERPATVMHEYDLGLMPSESCHVRSGKKGFY